MSHKLDKRFFLNPTSLEKQPKQRLKCLIY